MAKQQYEDKDAGKYASLPLISVLAKPDMTKARRLLQELEGLVAARKEMEEREDEIKELLAALQQDNSLPGLRDQGRCFCVETLAGRKTLDKGLLVDNGVTAEQIEASMKEGKPYDRKVFKVVPL